MMITSIRKCKYLYLKRPKRVSRAVRVVRVVSEKKK